MASWTIRIKLDLSPNFRGLDPDRALVDLRICLRVQRDIGAGFRVQHEHRIGDRARIKSLARELGLFLLERLGRIELARDAYEDGVSIGRQALSEMGGQRLDVKALVHHDRAHAGAAIGAGDVDAVGGGIDHAGEIAYGVVDLRGRDVLALPAKGVADAIDEVEEAFLVEPHQIAGAEPGIALGKDIAQDLLLGLARLGVALEAAAALIRRADAAYGFAGLAARAGDAKSLCIAQRRTIIGVELDETGRETMREQRRDAADRAGLALDVEQREIAFRRRVEFEDARNGETRLKIVPDVTAQAVAADESQAMPVLVFRRRRLEQIAAELTYILEQRTVVAHDIGPEIRGREFFRDRHRPAGGEHAAWRDDAADRVEQRQAIVEPILRRRAGEAGEPKAPIEDAAVADACGFRQARGPGGVDQQRA